MTTPVSAQSSGERTLNAGWLLETARTTILTSDPWLSSDCLVDISGSPNDFIVYRDGEIRVTGVLERTPNSLRDTGAVAVEVFVGEELYMRFDPSPYLVVTVTVFQAADDLERFQVLTEADVEEVSVDVRSLPSDDMFESLDDIVGLAARMNIQNGRILTTGLLELPILVNRSDSVLVAVPIGSIEITLNGIALDSGALGDEIRVRNPDTDAIITAVVTGPDRAEIQILN